MQIQLIAETAPESLGDTTGLSTENGVDSPPPTEGSLDRPGFLSLKRSQHRQMAGGHSGRQCQSQPGCRGKAAGKHLGSGCTCSRVGPWKMTTTNRQKKTAPVNIGSLQVTPVVQQEPPLATFLSALETQQLLIRCCTSVLEISADLTGKRMRRIHNPPERILRLQFRRDGFRPIKRPNLDLINVEACVSARRCGRDNAHRHPPTVSCERRGQMWAFPCSGQKPNSILAKAAALHQDDPRKR